MTKKDKSKQEINTLKKHNTVLSKQIEEYKEQESLVNSIHIENLDSLESLSIKPNLRLKEEAIAISTLNDVHVEERVVKSVVNGLNEYNPDIAKQRIERYFKRLMYLIHQSRKAGYRIDNLVLALLGDLITGYIHEELEETNFMSPAEAILFIQSLVISGLKSLSEDGNFTSIKIPCIPGNHGRTTKRKRFISGYRNSYEWLMYNEMKRIFELSKGYENIEFIVSESEFIYMDLFGYINKFSHGDHFNYQGGIGGIEVPLKKWIHRENSVIKTDMSWLAHWHQYITLNRARISGSVIGYNAFARAYGFEPEAPRMQFQLLDKKRGFTLNNPIYLTDF